MMARMQELLDSRRVHYFQQVVASGSVRGAAEQLGIEPSAVSRAVAQLEKDCGLALLERRGRGVVPTDAGRLLATYARRQQDVQTTFYAELDSLRNASRGHVDLVMGEGMLDLFFDPLVADYARAYPQVTLGVNVASTAEGIDLLLEDKVDLGIIFQPPRDVRLRSHQSTTTAPIQAVVHHGHPLAALKRPLRLSDLLDYPGAAAFDSFGVRQQVKAAEISEQVQLRNVLTSNSFKVLWQFAGAGLGYALLAARTPVGSRVPAGVHLPEVVALPMANPLLNRASMHVMTRVGRHLSPAAHTLLAHVMQRMAARYSA